MNAEDVRNAIRAHHAGSSSAVIFEVPDGVGRGNKSGRMCDAMIVEFWESRGLEVQGFEIKVERGDWLRELKMPAKSDAHFVRCDRWWLITPSRKAAAPVARAEEIPGPWGWMVVDPAGKLEVYKKAPKLVPSMPFDKTFAFALVRAAARYDLKAIRDEVDRRVKAKEVDFTARVNARAASLVRPEVDPEDQKLLAALRTAFGTSLNWLQDAEVVTTIKLVRELRQSRQGDRLVEAAKLARTSADALDRLVDALAHALEP